MFKQYVLSFHKETVLNILNHEDELRHFSVNINFVELFEHDPILGNSILTQPESSLKLCDKLLLEVQEELLKGTESAGAVLTKKHYVHARIFGLPACPELHKLVFPTNDDLGLFLQISGTITRISGVKMLEYKREYTCVKCKYTFVVNASYEQSYMISPPKCCRNPEFCKGTSFRTISALGTNHCLNYQEFTIQEQFSKHQVSMLPDTLCVTLEDDLVDVCNPGDSVMICGIVKRRWNIPPAGKPLEVELVIKANHIEVNNDTCSRTVITSEILESFSDFWEKHETMPLYGRDLILRSFCPQIYGMYVVKLAIATVLAGGSIFERDKKTGTRVRTEPHLLLVGDPGMGKSQLLRYAAEVIPRSVLTTGVGSTSAGLTVTAVMEDGEWQMEGGALVLADGGICCIDEFNSMMEHDRASIHEAMEQQTISIAKASIVSKLNTRCSILAATNPRFSLEANESLTITVALASPLLSRFDLILFLKDDMDNDRDEKISNYILRGYKRKSKFFDNKYNMWSVEMLQAYFSIIKRLNPVLTETSKRILGAYYQSQRKQETRDKSRTTVRLLDSLVRLSQAHARLMCHGEVETMDAVMALALIETSMRGGSSVISEFFDQQSDFVDDPMKNYERLLQAVFSDLQLDDILERELQMLKSYENGEVVKSSRVNILDINIAVKTNLKHKDTNCEQETMSESRLNGNNAEETTTRRNNLDDLINEFEMNKSRSYTSTQNSNKSNINSNKSSSDISTQNSLNSINRREKVEKRSDNNLTESQNEAAGSGRLNKRKISSDSDNSQNSCEIIESKKSKIGEIHKTPIHELNASLSFNSDISSKEIEDAFNFLPKSTQIGHDKTIENNRNKNDHFNASISQNKHDVLNPDTSDLNCSQNKHDELNPDTSDLNCIQSNDDIQNFNLDSEKDCDFEDDTFGDTNVGKPTENKSALNKTVLHSDNDANSSKSEQLFKRNGFKNNIQNEVLNNVTNFIASEVFSQDLQISGTESNVKTANKGKFNKKLSNLSIVKSDSGNFSQNSQNIFEMDDDFDDCELDI